MFIVLKNGFGKKSDNERLQRHCERKSANGQQDGARSNPVAVCNAALFVYPSCQLPNRFWIASSPRNDSVVFSQFRFSCYRTHVLIIPILVH